MKHTGRLSIYFSLLFIFLFGIGNQTFGQEKFNISGGLGFPDGLNIGARYQLKQDTLQIGISLGLGGFVTSISGDVFWNFSGHSRLSARPPLYFKAGLNILIPDSEYEWGPLFNLRLGRDINLSRKVGLNLEGGFAFSVSALEMQPSFGIYFFYRL